MKISTTQATALFLVRLDGHADTGAPARLCATCGKPMVQFAVSPGLASETGLPAASVVCVNKRWKIDVIPCPEALKAKALLDRLGAVL